MDTFAKGILTAALLAATTAAAAATAPQVAAGIDSTMTAKQIVEKNVAARGGADAWHKIEAMVWVGHIESAAASGANMPFVLNQARPNKTRFEMANQKKQVGLRVFDGTQGWKLRNARNGSPEVESFSIEELAFARENPGIDGELIDYTAKGIDVALEGTDTIDDKPTYRLRVTLPTGTIHHEWIDAQTFLEVKSDRIAHNGMGQVGTVTVFYRNYHAVEGVQIPFTIESGIASGRAPDRMIIDRVAINPQLDMRTFDKPIVPRRRGEATIDITPPAHSPQASAYGPSSPYSANAAAMQRFDSGYRGASAVAR